MTQPTEPALQQPARSYFMVADILGFSQIIANLSPDAQSDRINQWIGLVEDVKSEVGIKDTQGISDTLFVREEDSEGGLERMLKFARLLLHGSIERSFPIRGAIVHGDVAWGALTHGHAVVDAYRMEQSLDWIGIACSPHLPRVDSFWSWDLVAVYPAPRKSGLTQLLPVVAWDVPMARELVRRVSSTGSGLMQEGQGYRWAELSKIERTIQFGMYLRRGKSSGIDPRSYGGMFPMEWIESAFGAP